MTEVDSRLVYTITVETGIPLPARAGRPKKGAATLRLPFDDLKPPRVDPVSGRAVLDSFFVPGAHRGSVQALASKESTRSRYKRFTTRWLDHDPHFKIPGVRVWREA